jgi:integrase
MRVQVLVRNDGERVPFLMSKNTGMPFFYPTVYSTTELRTRNVQSATIAGKLFSIMHSYAWAKNKGIDLETRFIAEGRFLDYSEVKSLQAAVRLKHKALIEQEADIPDLSQRPVKVLSLARIRRRVTVIKSQHRTSGADTVLGDIILYLDWLAMKGMNQVPATVRCSDAMDKDRDNMSKWLKAGLKTVKGHRNNSVSDFLEGLSHKDEERLFELIDPKARDNPFSHKHVKMRNFVFLKVCRLMALRKSEALGLMIDDIDFKSRRIMIYRRPDNPDDSRINEPNAKTLDRELLLPNELVKLLKTYIEVAGVRETA